jgi:hypothetical protein
MASMSEWGQGAIEILSDAELEGELLRLLNGGARTEALIVAHLAEVEGRRLHLRVGFPSMFQYCQQQLKLSESEAFHRIVAARLATAFPLVLELLSSRQIHLSAICLLRRHLTAENHRELLNAACGKSKRQVELLLACRFPDLDFETERRRAGRLQAVTNDLYRLEVVLTGPEKARFELARDLTSHANPTGSWSVLLVHAIEALVEKTEKRRFAKLEMGAERATSTRQATSAELGKQPATRPGSPPPEAHSSADDGTARTRDHIPRHIRREVVARDGLACTFVGESGRRCGARAFLQLEHAEPWAKGGADTPENLRVLCAQHNQLLAEQEFGRSKIESEIAQRRADSTPGQATVPEQAGDDAA